MPLYDYLCEENGETVEVVHRMADKIETWGQLCEHAQRPLGDTPADSPVKKIPGRGNYHNGPKTMAKDNATLGERTKQLGHGPTVSPMRSSKF